MMPSLMDLIHAVKANMTDYEIGLAHDVTERQIESLRQRHGIRRERGKRKSYRLRDSKDGPPIKGNRSARQNAETMRAETVWRMRLGGRQFNQRDVRTVDHGGRNRGWHRRDTRAGGVDAVSTCEELLAMVEQGMGDHDIAARLGVSEMHAKRLRLRQGITRPAGRGRFRWSAESTAEVIDMLREGKSIRKITDALGYPYQRVQDKVTRIRTGMVFLPVQTKPRRCLRCREDFASEHAGNRICGACAPLVADMAPMMIGVSL